jgi:hypothetical protein
MTLENILEAENEIKRFQIRIKEAKKRINEDKYALYGCKETGALKRGAMDLKNVLTKLTK